MSEETMNTTSAEELAPVDPEFIGTGYAVRNDGQGWRSVASEADLLDGETFQIDQPTPSTTNPTLLEIYKLEALITPRRVRDAILGKDNGWLADIESEITALRVQL